MRRTMRTSGSNHVSTLVGDLPEGLYADAVALWHATGLTRPWNDPMADLIRAITHPTSTVLAALDDAGALLGTAMVGHDGHRGWVYYVAINPDHQGRGLGRRLMQASEEWVRDRGVPKIQLMVRHTNEHAVAFYRALGYVDSQTTVLGRFL
jgi:ribosomal protein S18 acetylase RimI-like enzyme